MNRRTPIIALALGGALWAPRVASAAPDTDAAAVRIEVEVTVAPETSLPADDETWKTMRKWVTDNQKAALEDAGFVVSDDAPHVMRTEIEVYGEYGVNTKGTLVLVDDGGEPRRFVCKACRDSEILAKIDDETAALTERLRAKVSAEGESNAQTELVAEDESRTGDGGEGKLVETRTSDEPTDREAKRLGVAGYVGIGAMAAGVGVSIGGVIVLTREPEERLQADSSRFVESVHRRPLGGALTGVGAGLLVAGVVLVVVDQTVLRKRRDQRSTALVPSLNPNGAGLAWVARF